jgi:nicotinamide riboside transporter PnuC
MKNSFLRNKGFLYTVLFLQIVPLLLFPPSVFEISSQKWWLPAILVLLTILATAQLLRKTVAPWALYMIAFTHGFNIISRLLMLLPQSTETPVFDGLYFVFSVISILFSALILWLVELPQVRQVLIH